MSYRESVQPLKLALRVIRKSFQRLPLFISLFAIFIHSLYNLCFDPIYLFTLLFRLVLFSLYFIYYLFEFLRSLFCLAFLFGCGAIYRGLYSLLRSGHFLYLLAFALFRRWALNCREMQFLGVNQIRAPSLFQPIYRTKHFNSKSFGAFDNILKFFNRNSCKIFEIVKLQNDLVGKFNAIVHTDILYMVNKRDEFRGPKNFALKNLHYNSFSAIGEHLISLQHQFLKFQLRLVSELFHKFLLNNLWLQDFQVGELSHQKFLLLGCPLFIFL